MAGGIGWLEAPGSDAQQLGDGGVGVSDDFALTDQLSRDRDVTLMCRDITLIYGVSAGDEGHSRDRGKADDQGHERSDESLPTPNPSASSAVAGIKERTFGVAERR